MIKVNRITYEVGLNALQYDKLECLSYTRLKTYFDEIGQCLDVDYDGHFGNKVFITFRHEVDNNVLMNAVIYLLGHFE